MFHGLNYKYLYDGFEDYNNVSNIMRHIDESFQSYLCGVTVRRHSFLSETLYMFILEYQQHGHYAFAEKLRLPKVIGKVEEEDKPKVLTMQMLSAGFIVWLISILVSVFAFVCEIVSKLVAQKIANQ